MKTKVLKIMSLSIMLMLAFAVMTMPVFAAEGFEIPEANAGTKGVSGIMGAGSTVLSIVTAIGMAVAVVILVWLAIKYITAAPSDKADVKKSAVAYVIGAVLLFAASGVLALIRGFATDFSDSLEEGSIVRRA